MEDWLDKKHAGLANTLRAHGWSTMFCTTHDPEFDTMKGFLTSHGFDRVISEDDYPDDWIVSTNGVPDHRMFEFALPELNKLAKKGPFLSAFMTTSDHKPFILPDSLWFEPKSEKLEDRIVEYADRSVARFFELASKEPWYKKTVFVILGDHGVNMGHTYDMPMSFHHTPLLFHVPGGQVSPGLITSPCGQIDVAPTLLGMLNVPWTNRTMGIDIRQDRLMANIDGSIARQELNEDDSGVSWLPLYHDMGLIGFILAPMCAQRSVDLLAPQDFARRPTQWLSLISRRRATITYSPSFGYDLVARRAATQMPEDIDLSCLKLAGIGADLIRLIYSRKFEIDPLIA